MKSLMVLTLENIISGNILEHISYDHLPNFNQDDFSSNQITNATDTNQAYNVFHKNFLNTLNNYAPFKFLSKRATKTKQKPWNPHACQQKTSKKLQ